MTCNRSVHQSSQLAARCGMAPQTLAAAWAEGRKGTRHCPTCGAFLRADGGCTQCEQRQARAQHILAQAKGSGQFSELAWRLAPGGQIVIENIAVKPGLRRQGIATTLLRALNEAGATVHIEYPVESALLFWLEMYERGLIADDPEDLPTYEAWMDEINLADEEDEGA